MGNIGEALITILVGMCIFCLIVGVGGYYVVDRFVVDHDIRTKKPLKPVIEVKYSSETGIADTTYIYKIK